MFDFRYHIASLAAVFVALVIGILVGVGLSGSGVTKQTDLRLARAQRDAANARVASQAQQIQRLAKTQKAFEIAYPAVMRDLLSGKRFAVLFVGPVDGGVSQAIERTLVDAGAVPPIRVVSLNVPIKAQNLDNTLFGKGAPFTQYVGNDELAALGSALAGEFEAGGQTPLWKLLGTQLIGERSGNTRQRVDGVIVVRTAKPQSGDTARFLRGLLTGLASADLPAVGVEKTNTAPSAAAVFRDRGLTSVDDIDLATGRAALAFVLAGAAGGRYGIAEGDDAVLPPPP